MTEKYDGEERRHPPEAISKYIDTRIPLVWLMGTGGAFAVLLFGIYFNVQRLSEDVGELKATSKAGNIQAATVAGEVAIIKWRLDNLEDPKNPRNK